MHTDQIDYMLTTLLKHFTCRGKRLARTGQKVFRSPPSLDPTAMNQIAMMNLDQSELVSAAGIFVSGSGFSDEVAAVACSSSC